MTDPKEFNSLDELFRKTFEDLPDTPAPSGWDAPSPQLWNEVRVRLKPPRSGWSTQALMLVKGSFVAEKDYARLIRRLPDLLAPGGHALLCLNSPKLGVGFLHDQVRAQAPGLVFCERLPNPPAFADVSSERSLKVLLYRAAV